jgi:hypothetical protein
MPSRIIREGWLESEPINGLSKEAEVFFLRLCLRADDYGRYHANPILLKSNLYPLKEAIRSTDIPRWVAECETAGLVRCYEHSKKRFLEIIKFGQRTRTDSKFPSPEDEGVTFCQTNDGQMTVKSQQCAGVVGGVVGCGGVVVVGSRANGSPQHKVSDEQWRKELQASDAYRGINIEGEFQKMIFWCQQKKKQPSRSRFLGWLNRIDRPMEGSGAGFITCTPAEEIRRLEDEFRTETNEPKRELIRRKIVNLRGTK